MLNLTHCRAYLIISLVICSHHALGADLCTFSPDLQSPLSSQAGALADRIPRRVELLQFVALYFRDTALEDRMEREFGRLKGEALKAVPADDKGYLFKIRVFTYESGAMSIPGSQLIYPVGPGSEPAEALSRTILGPTIMTSDPPPPAMNSSSYIWLAKGGGQACQIPAQHRREFELLARNEAQRKLDTDRAAGSFGGATRSAKVASFWDEVASANAQALSSAKNRDEIARLTARSDALTAEFEQLVAQYHETDRQMREAASFYNVLSQINALTTLIDSGTKAEKLFTSNDAKVDSAGPKESSSDLKKAADKINALEKRASAAERRLKELQKAHRSTNEALKSQYRKNGVQPGKGPVLIWH